jgi:hypothetical protein
MDRSVEPCLLIRSRMVERDLIQLPTRPPCMSTIGVDMFSYIQVSNEGDTLFYEGDKLSYFDGDKLSCR